MCRVRVNLENLVYDVAVVFDAVQSPLEIRLLIRPTGTGGQVQANKTCMQRLANIAGRLARAAGSRSEIVRVSSDERPVAVDDRLHELVVFPAGHAPTRYMCALRVASRHGHLRQHNGQALVDQEFQECLTRFKPRPSSRRFSRRRNDGNWSPHEVAPSADVPWRKALRLRRLYGLEPGNPPK